MSYNNENKIKTFRHTKSERIHHKQVFILRNVKETLSSRMEMTPDENMNPHKGLKNTGNGNYMGKYVINFLIIYMCAKVHLYVNRLIKLK